MKWPLVRRILIGAGILYCVALIPSSIRPSWSAAPFRKSDQTINVIAASKFGTPPTNLKDKIKQACLAATPLRPLMGSAHHVRVVLTWNEHALSVHEYNCELYV